MKIEPKEMTGARDAILDSMPEYVILLDTEKRVLWANMSAYGSIGTSLEDIVGKQCSLVFNKSPNGCAGCPADRALSSKKPSDGEVTTPDGRIWSIKAYPVPGDTHEVGGVVEIREDITERKISEESVRETKELFRLMADNARDLIFRYRLLPAKGFDYISPSSEVITGYAPDEYYTNRDLFFTIMLPGYRQKAQDYFESTYVDTRSFDVCLARKDGKKVWLEVLLGPEHDQRGKIVSVQGIGRDITEWKQDKDRQKLVVQIFEVLNRVKEKRDRIMLLLLLIKEYTGFEAVGIRLKEGDDYPYYETSGFEANFVERERYICTRGENGEILRDAAGTPTLECLCGAVVSGKIDHALPFYTRNGSFWTNDKPALDALSKKGTIPRLRGRCFSEGYESVALIPLRSDSEIVGVLQLNDRRKNMITEEMLGFFEGIGTSIGLAFQQNRSEEEIESLTGRLKDAQKRVKTLSGLLPLCERCMKIRDAAGSWHKVEEYIKDHPEVRSAPTTCPDCSK